MEYRWIDILSKRSGNARRDAILLFSSAHSLLFCYMPHVHVMKGCNGGMEGKPARRDGTSAISGDMRRARGSGRMLGAVLAWRQASGPYHHQRKENMVRSGTCTRWHLGARSISKNGLRNAVSIAPSGSMRFLWRSVWFYVPYQQYTAIIMCFFNV